jgi:hypothetical protein
MRMWVGRTNRNAFDLLDQGRRQVDHLGLPGTVSKTKQTNDRYEKKGYLRFAPLRPSQIRQLQARIDELGEPAIKTWRFKNPRRFKNRNRL